jgi:hypothetical protein
MTSTFENYLPCVPLTNAKKKLSMSFTYKLLYSSIVGNESFRQNYVILHIKHAEMIHFIFELSVYLARVKVGVHQYDMQAGNDVNSLKKKLSLGKCSFLII